ncbi:hypothetical protein GA0004736_3378 [Curtobacterium sp. 9128]|uniref:hypothetical protein n=1 Tax=Curtobacterium sp. 9128 TaxID=1793722 RepID=UPI0007D72AE6|nr:hypothetical protein [Curtobacterium sp. 9128]SBN64418.1 hypothetical protein GA0004736_3378 [Curtobacterium sp. 9128]
MLTQTFTDTLVVISCAHCDTAFGMTQTMHATLRRDHGTFYCPRGHANHYPGESDLEREQRLRKLAEQQTRFTRASRDAARDQADAAERSARAYKGHVTRLRNRIANGVCPVADCRRSFSNVRRHIAGQHPEWAHEHPEAMTS